MGRDCACQKCVPMYETDKNYMRCVFSDFYFTVFNSCDSLRWTAQKIELRFTGELVLTFCWDPPGAGWLWIGSCYGYKRGLLSRAGTVTAVAMSGALNPWKLLRKRFPLWWDRDVTLLPSVWPVYIMRSINFLKILQPDQCLPSIHHPGNQKEATATDRAKGIPRDLLSFSEKILNVLQMLLLPWLLWSSFPCMTSEEPLSTPLPC